MAAKLLTVMEVAELLGCSKSWLDQLRCSGRGPRYLKVGGRVRYRPEDVEAWLAARERQSTAQGAA